ncbi:MAG: ABC transporter permease [Streptosporangiales bacterium]|nr:ABC transporter permease [Streptosporangiales bacterium]
MRYVLRRIGFYLVTVWAAVTINFFIPRLMPGNPVDIMVSKLSANGGLVNPGTVASLRAQFGMGANTSLLSQYFQYWDQLFHGNLGKSIGQYPATVVSVIGQHLPWTIGLIGSAVVIAFIVGTVIGTYSAWRRGTWLDSALPVSAFLQALPYFWLGLVAVQVFALNLGWFPRDLGGSTLGASTTMSWSFVGDASYHALLPAITIVLTSLSGWMVGQRNMMITTLDQDYVLVAQAKGVSPRRVMWLYAARNAILPQFASFAVALGLVVSGSLVVELVFNYPGIGTLLLNAVGNEDYTLMQGIFLVITLTVLAANFLADIAYVILDPRARQEA